MSLQLTSSSGEQTFYEAALRLNQDVENLSLLSYSYCITGISKPVDKVECTKQMHLKLSANLIIRGVCIMGNLDDLTRAIKNELAFTHEELKELERARTMPITFDEDCPETTPERAMKFRRVNPVRRVAN